MIFSFSTIETALLNSSFFVLFLTALVYWLEFLFFKNEYLKITAFYGLFLNFVITFIICRQSSLNALRCNDIHVLNSQSFDRAQYRTVVVIIRAPFNHDDEPRRSVAYRSFCFPDHSLVQ